jgi:hypothetical protein
MTLLETTSLHKAFGATPGRVAFDGREMTLGLVLAVVAGVGLGALLLTILVEPARDAPGRAQDGVSRIAPEGDSSASSAGAPPGELAYRATARPVTRISGCASMSIVSRLGRPMSTPWWTVTVTGGVTSPSSRR